MSNKTGLDFRNIDFTKLEVRDINKTERGGISGKIVYNNQEIEIQVPICRMPYGFSAMSGDSGRQTYSVSGSFDKTSPILTQWLKFNEGLEEWLIDYAHKNFKTLFPKKKSLSAVEARVLLNPIVKIPGDEEKAAKYDPTFKTVVRAKADGTGYWTNCYDVDKMPMSIADIHKGCKGRMVIRLSSIYVINGKFGITWDLDSLFVTQHSSHAVIQEDPNMYGEAPPSAADVYDEHMEEALQRAEAQAKREREEKEGEGEEETSVKKTKKNTKK